MRQPERFGALRSRSEEALHRIMLISFSEVDVGCVSRRMPAFSSTHILFPRSPQTGNFCPVLCGCLTYLAAARCRVRGGLQGFLFSEFALISAIHLKEGHGRHSTVVSRHILASVNAFKTRHRHQNTLAQSRYCEITIFETLLSRNSKVESQLGELMEVQSRTRCLFPLSHLSVFALFLSNYLGD